MKEFGPNRFGRLAQGSEARRAMIEANLGVWTAGAGPLNDQQKPFFWMRWIPSPVRPLLYGGVTLTGLAAAACFGGGGPKPKPEQPPDAGDNVPKVQRPIDKPEPEQFIIPVINTKNPNEPIFLNSGPHFDGLTGGVRAAFDLAGKNVMPCPGSETSKEMAAIAAARGKVTVVGNEKNRADENHSIVEITVDDGLTLGYMHLDDIQVEVGQMVKAGAILGFFSCEVSPGGKTDGQHLHFYIKKDGKFIPIKGFIFSGWQIDESRDNYQGTATKPGQTVRTADRRRCDNDKVCNGLRNDLVEGEVLGVRTTVPTVPTATPRPTPIVTPEPTKIPELKPIKDLDKEYALGVIKEINRIRSASGLSPFEINNFLMRASEEYAGYLREIDFIKISSYLNGTPQSRAQQNGYRGRVKEVIGGQSSLDKPVDPVSFFLTNWHESEVMDNFFLNASLVDIGVGCIKYQEKIINNRGAILNFVNVVCVIDTGSTQELSPESRRFSDPYSAALDWYVWNLAFVRQEWIGCTQQKPICIQLIAQGERAVLYNLGIYQTDSARWLFIGQHPEGLWEAVHYHEIGHPFFPPIPGTTAVIEGTGDGLNVRENPSLSAKRLTTLADGTKVKIDGRFVFADGYVWAHLENRGWSVINYLAGCDPTPLPSGIPKRAFPCP